MSFAEDLSFGREGEVIVRNLLESSGNLEQVIDCSNDSYFQQKDIENSRIGYEDMIFGKRRKALKAKRKRDKKNRRKGRK